MSMLAVCSTKGSPGATVLSLALTCALGDDDAGPAGLVEADPAGGDLAALLGLATDPGMVSLAAGWRRQADWPDVRAHAQTLPSGGWTILGSTDPTQAGTAISTVVERLPAALLHAGGQTVADCGRWSAGSPASQLMAAAAVTIVCVRPTVVALESVRVRAWDLWQVTAGRVGLAVVGPSPYGAGEIQEGTGLPILGCIPIDRRGVDGLLGRVPTRSVRRSPLVRAARTLCAALDRLDCSRDVMHAGANGMSR